VLEAVDVSFEHTIPFLPQLPRIDAMEFMIPLALNGFPGAKFGKNGMCEIDVDKYRSRQSSSSPFSFGIAIDSFVSRLNQQRPVVAKVQIAGPMTVSQCTTVSSGTIDDISDSINQHLAQRAVDLVELIRVKSPCVPLIFIYEPVLNLKMKNLEPLLYLIQRLKQTGALIGIHCCGEANWSALCQLDLDVLSFDAQLSLNSLMKVGLSLQEFLLRGSSLALGGSLDSPQVDSTLHRLKAFPTHQTNRIIPQLLLTPTCGLALKTFEEADAEKQRLKVLQQRVERNDLGGAKQPG
jgi:hypothetical protein